jgi:hypothetical protein
MPLLSALAIIYIAQIIIFSFFDPNATKSFLESINLGNLIPSFIYFSWENVNATISLTYPGLLKIFLLSTLFLSLYAWFVLSKGRNIFEVFLLFVVYLIPQPEEYWGKVLDKSTFRPIPFSSIKVMRTKTGLDKLEFISEAITDLYGRYRININVEPGYRYYLQINAPEHQVLIKEISSREDKVISIYDDILVEPMISKNNSLIKDIFNALKAHLNKYIVTYLYLASLFSLLLGIRVFLLTGQSTPGNYIFIIQYIIAVVFNTGRIYNLNNNSFGRIMLYDKEQTVTNLPFQLMQDNKIVEKKQSNADGSLNFNVSPGVYELELLDDRYEIVNTKGDSKNLTQVIISDKGLLKTNVIVKPKRESNLNIDSNNTLQNPFE